MTGFQSLCNDKKQALGLSSADIAEISGLSVSTVRNFLSGYNKSPSLNTAVLISKALGISIDDYFSITPLPDHPRQDTQLEFLQNEIAMLKLGIRARNRILVGVAITISVLLVTLTISHLIYFM